ncbi:Cysteine-rich receptor-like protein kinase 10 [Raphanus sativus]|uniref:Cysteine-rich receptor-like protein kinase 15 n=1 Tax=Raphanus sativus TaxID=3726 RepID=A0A6J0KND8_RAPSA|nr:cysteine-rich receptor-like protein kinase 15 [Raphanus sativus]KAJ4899889.1 Cysteine-rich receptor-like protein kinase 10 [Raphanus sativus]
MSSQASFILIFLFSFLTTSFRTTAESPSFVHHLCRNTTRYSANSIYSTNLKTLWSSLSSANASYSTGFQNATAGQAPNLVTGLFLCRGDVSPEDCRDCVSLSVKDIAAKCTNQREAIIYYDECMLRYSDQSVFSNLTVADGFLMYNDYETAPKDVDLFKKLALTTMTEAAFEAANSSRYFLTRKAKAIDFKDLYFLVQCTPDLTRDDCLFCLLESINGLHFENIGSRLLFPSCNSRYENYKFYNETEVNTTTTILPPPPPLAASTTPRPRKGGNSKVLAIAILVAIIMALLLSIAGYCFLAKRKKKTSDNAPTFYGDDMTTVDSLQLDYRTIQAATNDYSENNKIGQGGFGEVYKGTFLNGTEVAVKRLSKSSGQGETEFKNEVVVVAKLQHRNLVKLMGFSLEREERILVYEYVPNKSLDYFLFDSTKKGQLYWTRRYKIVEGITRGMLYLHQDSRLTIIHRDLKTSNILLDGDMNPKIADFGMARIFGMEQTQENTNRIVGTHGYMSPEYVIHGQFSMKSDVYSFGVLVLEIITGRKNSSFYERDGAHNLVTYAWRLWNNKTELDLVDPVIVDNCQMSEVVRCIHIGLLCVQEDPIERPTFSTILMMLTSNSVILPVPQQPGFVIQTKPKKDLPDSNQSTMTKSGIRSVGDASGH